MFQSYSLFTVHRVIQRSPAHFFTHASPSFAISSGRAHSTLLRSASSRSTAQGTVENVGPARASPGPQSPGDVKLRTRASRSSRISETLAATLQEWHKAEACSDFAQLEAIVVSLVRDAAEGVKDANTVIEDLLEQLPDSRLPLSTITAILKILHPYKHLNQLSLSATLRFAQLCGLTTTQLQPLQVEMLELLTPVIVQHLHAHQAPRGPPSLRYKPPEIVPMCFSLVRQYLNLASQPKALSVFRVLSQTSHIPEGVTRRVDTSSKNFAFIMRVTLIQAALHWGWRPFAWSVLTEVIRDSTTPLSSREDLYALLTYLLDSPTPTDVSRCGRCIMELHRHNGSQATFPPNSLIHRFYASAKELNRVDDAEKFYNFTLLPDVMEAHTYPAPTGHAVLWLMERLCASSKNEHLARQFASAVIQQDVEIPLGDRPRFICLIAAIGFATQTRAVWEKYSLEKRNRPLVGNAAVAVRLTKLYTSLIVRETQKIQWLQSPAASASPSSSPPMTEPTDEESPLSELELRRDKIQQYEQFTDRVINLFQSAHSPLERASHTTLTSLARIFILRSRFAEAMQTMKLILQRHEIPDMYDVNVALSALALHDPRNASKTILLMLEKNLIPTPVTFGTVIHQALVHKDYDLADEVVQLALDQNTQIDLKSLVSLMRASVNEDVDPLVLRENIRRAWSVVHLLGSSHIVSSAKTGKYFIGACIRANDAVMAFKFWQELILHKVEWGDQEHWGTRVRIESMLEAQQLAGSLQPEVVRRMRSLLRGRAPREVPSVGGPSAAEDGQ